MEEVGKGARLVFRYPAAPPPYFLDRGGSSGGGHSTNSNTKDVNNNGGNTHMLPGNERRGTIHGTPVKSTRKSHTSVFADTTATNSGNNNSNGNSGATSSSSGSIDLFFDLPARVISKLFRPKRPLCGQPLTLNVSGTTFCCRAELFDSHPHGNPSTVIGGGGGEGSSSSSSSQSHPLVLFSVIVALAPLASLETTATPSSSSSSSQQPFQSHYHPTTIHDSAGNNGPYSTSRADSAFTTVRRVHRNLARLCRVLTREEFRCRYVSLQCSMLLQIRKEYESRVGPDGEFNTSSSGGAVGNSGSGVGSVDVTGSGGGNGGGGAVSGGGGGGGGGSGSGSDSNKDGSSSNSRRVSSASGGTSGVVGAGAGPPPMSPKDKRVTSSGSANNNTTDSKSKVGGGASPDNHDDSSLGGKMSCSQRREYVQNLIEVLLAASLESVEHDFSGEERLDFRRHHGNLARELAHVFHSLSKHDDPSCPSTIPAYLSRVSGREGVVYINRHIAIPLEPVGATSIPLPNFNAPLSKSDKYGCVRPYHTLLFPHSSPSEILKNLLDETGSSSMNNAIHTSTVGANIMSTSSTAGSITDMSTSSSLSHTIRRILTQLHPRKSLQELAWDVALPLPQVMDAATWLVQSGVCVAIMPVLRKNRYACVEGVVGKMGRLALPFWQTFGMRSKHCRFYLGGTSAKGVGGRAGAPHVFVIVSALTTMSRNNTNAQGEGLPIVTAASPTLGDAIDSICGIDQSTQGDRNFNSIALSTRRASAGSLVGARVGVANPTSLRSVVGSSTVGGVHRRMESGTKDASSKTAPTLDVVYSMAVWLLAQKVITEVKDYLLAVGSLCDESVSGESKSDGNGSILVSLMSEYGYTNSAASVGINKATKSAHSNEELLFQELLESECLDGTKSIAAVCYQFGLDRLRMDRFKSWGQRRKLLEIISRTACPTDDWGTP